MLDVVWSLMNEPKYSLDTWVRISMILLGFSSTFLLILHILDILGSTLEEEIKFGWFKDIIGKCSKVYFLDKPKVLVRRDFPNDWPIKNDQSIIWTCWLLDRCIHPAIASEKVTRCWLKCWLVAGPCSYSSLCFDLSFDDGEVAF